MDKTERRHYFKVLVSSFYDLQDMRIRMANRLKKKADGTYQMQSAAFLSEESKVKLSANHKGIEKYEKDILKDIAIALRDFPIYTDFLSDVVGCGPTMAAAIISQFDINIGENVSRMWAYAGLNVVDGHSPRPTRGKKLGFNPWLRSKLLGVLGPCMLRANSPYRKHYDEYKHRLESKDWGTTDLKKDGTPKSKIAHRHAAANRHMIKEFIKDLYAKWRALEGLYVRPPYKDEYIKPHRE